jgi:GTP-binding protein Era
VIGLPNVGKSTLVNRLVEQKLSIVTAKAQTTRQRLLAIYTDDGHQAVFVDTPGLLQPRYLLQERMLAEADAATVDADLLLYVVDAGFPASVGHATDWQGPHGVPAILCLNKTDRIDALELKEMRGGFERSEAWRSVHSTVATRGEGVDELRSEVLNQLPAGPLFYPEDEVSTAPLRFFAAELVRETCFEELGQELPYSIAVGIEEFRESEVPIYVGATIFVERDSQKGMVIGKGGSMIRRIGTSARRKLEKMVESRVYLDLRVKVLRNWRRNPARLKLLGYSVPSRKV